MAFSFTDAGDALLYEESGSAAGLRITAAVAGVIAFAASFIFIWMITQGTGVPDSAAKVGGLVASLAALLAFWAFGGYCLHIALFIPQQQVRFDRGEQRIMLTTRSPARGSRSSRHAFAEVSSIEVAKNVSSDGDPSFELVLTILASKTMRIGSFAERDDADARLRQIEQMLRDPAS